MSLEYAQGRIEEALRLNKGNTTKARQQVIAWTYDDPKLLMALSRPHLTGIVAHAINRVIQNQKLHDEQDVIPETPEGIEMAPATFGQEIMNSLKSSNTPMFGFEGNVPPVSRRKASKSHVENLKRISTRRADGQEDSE